MLTRIKTGIVLDAYYTPASHCSTQQMADQTQAKIRGFLSRCQLDSQLNKKGHSKQALFKMGSPRYKARNDLVAP